MLPTLHPASQPGTSKIFFFFFFAFPTLFLSFSSGKTEEGSRARQLGGTGECWIREGVEGQLHVSARCRSGVFSRGLASLSVLRIFLILRRWNTFFRYFLRSCYFFLCLCARVCLCPKQQRGTAEAPSSCGTENACG